MFKIPTPRENLNVSLKFIIQKEFLTNVIFIFIAVHGNASVNSFCFYDDFQYIMTAGEDCAVRMWSYL